MRFWSESYGLVRFGKKPMKPATQRTAPYLEKDNFWEKTLTPLELHPRFLGTNYLELKWDSFFFSSTRVLGLSRCFFVMRVRRCGSVRFFSTIVRCGAEFGFSSSYAAARCGSLLSLDPTMYRTVKRPGKKGFRRFICLRVWD